MILKPCKPHHALLLTKVPLMIPFSLRIIVKISAVYQTVYNEHHITLSRLLLVHSSLSSDCTCLLFTLLWLSKYLFLAILQHSKHAPYTRSSQWLYIFTHISKHFPLSAALRSTFQSLLSRKAFPRHGIRYSLPSFCIYSALFFP